MAQRGGRTLAAGGDPVDEGVGCRDEGPDVGEVWAVDLSDARGHEQAGMRPAVILAVSFGMRIVVPLTTNPRAASFPHTHMVMPDGGNGLREESYALVFQVVSLDENRFTGRWGKLSDDDMESIKGLLQDMIGL